MGEKSTEAQEWESFTAGIAYRRTSKQSQALKGLKLDLPETLNRDDNKWKDPRRFDGWVHALERFLRFQDIDKNYRSASEFVGFEVINCGLVLYQQFQREQQEKD